MFAPTNAAFAEIEETVATLTTAQLSNVLQYHVVAGSVLSKDLVAGEVTMLNGETVTVDRSSGVQINDATVVLADIVTTNGIIHVIRQGAVAIASQGAVDLTVCGRSRGISAHSGALGVLFRGPIH